MDEYISRAGIIAEYDRQHKGPPGGARKIMETYPAADVREVSYAEDISDTVKGHHCEFKCSHCREEIAEHRGRDFDFCPYCGAVLRKQES